MKKFLVMAIVAMMTALSAEAQTSLVGREYHNPNIMSDIYKDIDRQVADMKAKALVKMTDEAMKAADIGWLKRKALKAAMAVMPAADMPYIIKGNMVILQDEEENDTLYISADRNSLSGIYRGKKKSENIHYTLARTK